jgi:hypothetical protein
MVRLPRPGYEQIRDLSAPATLLYIRWPSARAIPFVNPERWLRTENAVPQVLLRWIVEFGHADTARADSPVLELAAECKRRFKQEADSACAPARMPARFKRQEF